MDNDTRAGFETTRWTLLERLHDAHGAELERVRNEITRIMWPPVYAYVRREGKSRDEAEELTQRFFVECVCQHGLFETADRKRGRLRALLKRSLKNFLIDCHRRHNTRGGNHVHLSRLEDEELFSRHADAAAGAEISPDEMFEQRWASALLDEAMTRCERHFLDRGMDRHWKAFELCVRLPAVNETAPPNHNDAAEQLGFRTGTDVGSVIQVVRRRALAIWKDVISETIGPDEDVEDEYRTLKRHLDGTL